MIKQITEMSKALADENRVKILNLLSEKKRCVMALANILKISQPAVSQHLKILKNSGLLDSNKQGYHIHYSVNQDVLEDYRRLIKQLGVKK
jgi:DNA-binding transcriptional ArsR family regulator